ncbi:MAG: hypothetical protein OXC40_07330 [Proteobacteria bacterium]|nr:hypothetical protein [Pseudomonadota bacterium]
MIMVSACKLMSSSTHIQATTTATSIVTEKTGNFHRCEVIYPEVEDKLKNVLRAMFSRLTPDGQVDKTKVSHPVAQKVLARTRQMILNITRSNTRPIHPAAFFAVVKDFETSLCRDQWGINKIEFFTTNCDSDQCDGYFQVDTISEAKYGWNLEGVCGDAGLGVLGVEGGPDFCTAFFWWTVGEGGQKCAKVKENGGFTGEPTSRVTDTRVCNIYDLGKKSNNACYADEYTWTTDTFSYGHYCTYIQQNQWEVYGIHDTWRKLYTGFIHDYQSRKRDIHGYEYCAVHQYALSQYKQGTSEWPEFSFLDIPSTLLKKSVFQYVHDVGLRPVWAQDDSLASQFSQEEMDQIRYYNAREFPQTLFNQTQVENFGICNNNMKPKGDPKQGIDIDSLPKQYHPALKALREQADEEARQKRLKEQQQKKQQEQDTLNEIERFKRIHESNEAQKQIKRDQEKKAQEQEEANERELERFRRMNQDLQQKQEKVNTPEVEVDDQTEEQPESDQGSDLDLNKPTPEPAPEVPPPKPDPIPQIPVVTPEDEFF